nr:MAG TPA: hypothetical protein [Bacteriophage sp.]
MCFLLFLRTVYVFSITLSRLFLLFLLYFLLFYRLFYLTSLLLCGTMQSERRRKMQ